MRNACWKVALVNLYCQLRLLTMAVREGFEPSIRLQTVYSLSRGAPSAARPPHQDNEPNDNKLNKNLKLFLTIVPKILIQKS